MAWHSFTCLILALALAVGCAPRAEMYVDQAQSYAGIAQEHASTADHFKPMSRPLAGWQTERVVVFVMTPVAPRVLPVKKGYYPYSGSPGRAVSRVVRGSATTAVGALVPVPGADIIAGSLLSVIIPGPRERSQELRAKMLRVLDGGDYADQLFSKLEKSLASGTRGQLLMIAGSPERQSLVALKPTDMVISLALMVVMKGDAPYMLAHLHWNMGMGGEKYLQVYRRMEEKWNELTARGAKPEEWVRETKAINNLYDAHGILVYTSGPHDVKEWLDNDGQLIAAEWQKAVLDLTRQLEIQLGCFAAP